MQIEHLFFSFACWAAYNRSPKLSPTPTDESNQSLDGPTQQDSSATLTRASSAAARRRRSVPLGALSATQSRSRRRQNGSTGRNGHRRATLAAGWLDLLVGDGDGDSAVRKTSSG